MTGTHSGVTTGVCAISSRRSDSDTDTTRVLPPATMRHLIRRCRPVAARSMRPCSVETTAVRVRMPARLAYTLVPKTMRVDDVDLEFPHRLHEAADMANVECAH